MAEIIDVVTAVKRGDSIQVTIPARLVKRLGIRKGDRLAVYLTWDDEAKTEAILYVPVRAPGPGPEHAHLQHQAPGVHDEVLPAEASMKKRGQLSKARRADRARSSELTAKLACDGGEPEITIYDYSEHSRAWIEVDRGTRTVHIVQVLPYNPPEKVAVSFLADELPKLMAALEKAKERLAEVMP